MRVGIDARVLGTGIGGGDTYIRNVIRALPGVDPDGDYTLFLCPQQAGMEIAGAERMRRVIVPPDSLQIRVPFTLPIALARHRIDVAHHHFLAPLVSTARMVVQIHDLSYERYPQFFPREHVRPYKVIMPLVARRADAILTLSEFSKRDIVRRYCVPPERVVVTGAAANEIFRPVHDPARLAAVRARYGTGERFILSVGNLEPRKNLRTLIEAYVRLRKADATRHRLVLVGRKAWLFDEIFAAARESGYADELVFTDYVPDEDLVALYNAADLFVYPSLFEGFGLPPLEAMACGTPVIASNSSSLPEVIGDAGRLVDPLNANALAQAMAHLLTNPEMRVDLARRGEERAARFRWDASACVIADTYRRVAQTRPALSLLSEKRRDETYANRH